MMVLKIGATQFPLKTDTVFLIFMHNVFINHLSINSLNNEYQADRFEKPITLD